VAKSAMKSEPFSPSKMAIGTVPPQSRTATAPASKATTFLPAPRPARRDDEWETALARAKAASTSPAAEPTDPWEAAIRKAKTSAA